MRLNNWVFALLFLTSGLALILYIVFHLPILFGFLVNFLLLACLAFLHLRKRTPEERKHFYHLVRTGLIAGISSTLVYDMSRLILIKLTGIKFWPFDIFNIFGDSLLGSHFFGWFTPIAGVIYHVTNGVFFALVYVIMVKRPNIYSAILWGMILETLMVIFYPGWLQIKFIGEFLSVSIFGHFLYGFTLGWVARKLNEHEK